VERLLSISTAAIGTAVLIAVLVLVGSRLARRRSRSTLSHRVPAGLRLQARPGRTRWRHGFLDAGRGTWTPRTGGGALVLDRLDTVSRRRPRGREAWSLHRDCVVLQGSSTGRELELAVLARDVDLVRAVPGQRAGPRRTT